MIEYNSYFGGLLAAAATAASVEGDGEGGGEGGDEGGGLLRVQAVARQAAVYAVAVAAGEGAGAGADTSQGHASLGLQFYSHCSSPIRRYADLHNQHALFGTLPAGAAAPARIAELNERCSLTLALP